MRVKENQIFNLMDTNGRRNDVTNAFEIYLRCLTETYNDTANANPAWSNYPTSISQFLFYQKAIGYSSETFSNHPAYDRIIANMNDSNVMDDFLRCNDEAMTQVLGEGYPEFRESLDKDVEARARHYTSNLVKMGFTNDKRRISDIGNAILSNTPIQRDPVESLLPIDDTNLIYLRQLLKFRLFTRNNNGVCCSPVILAVYVLLGHDRITREDFLNLIQTLSPYKRIDNIDEFLTSYFAGNIDENQEMMPEVFGSDEELSDMTLRQYFTNARGAQNQDRYVEFYHLLFAFVRDRDEESLDGLLYFYRDRDNKSVIKKAFGYNRELFRNGNGNVEWFLEVNNDLDFLEGVDHFNERIYRRFKSSKTYDMIHEYSDTTARLLSATGVFKFRNGFVELAYPEIFREIFRHVDINSCVYGVSIEDYEDGLDSYYLTNHSLSDILGVTVNLDNITTALNGIYGTATPDELQERLANQRQLDFRNFIDEVFPKERTLQILEMFRDRRNDAAIQSQVSPSASVPTIFEYIVGISWYHLSGENLDLLNALNLSLDADFLPLTHAPGGNGDIIFYYDDCVVMLEVTLMNHQAQRQGEMEPVLRHAVNLTARNRPKDVVTFFIANDLDENTVRIWRASANIGLQTSDGTNETVEGVMIVPIKLDELLAMEICNADVASLISESIRSYHNYINEGDINTNWRKNIIDEVTNNDREE